MQLEASLIDTQKQLMATQKDWRKLSEEKGKVARSSSELSEEIEVHRMAKE